MAAKKIAAGLYEFKGFRIEHIEAGDCWHITVIGDDFPCDAANSLREAKEFISHWIECGTIPS